MKRQKDPSARRCEAFCINLTKTEGEKVYNLAKAQRRAPSELLYIIIADYLAGVIK